MDGYVDRAGQMSGRVLLGRTHIEHRHETFARAREQFLRGNRFELVFVRKVKPHDAFHFGDMRFADPADRGYERDHLVPGQTVIDVETLLAPENQPRLTQLLQVLRSVRDARTAHGRELLDRAFGLRQQLEEFDPHRAGQGRADAREVGKDLPLGIG